MLAVCVQTNHFHLPCTFVLVGTFQFDFVLHFISILLSFTFRMCFFFHLFLWFFAYSVSNYISVCRSNSVVFYISSFVFLWALSANMTIQKTGTVNCFFIKEIAFLIIRIGSVSSLFFLDIVGYANFRYKHLWFGFTRNISLATQVVVHNKYWEKKYWSYKQPNKQMGMFWNH